MSEPRRFFMRLLSFLRADRAERELTREMTAHLRQLEDDFVRKGLPPEEARLAARRAFGGGVEQAKEVQRDERSIRWLDELRQNVRYAVRTLLRAPGFTSVAVLTLALGIGANSVMFSIMNATMLQTLSFPEPERLVMLWQGPQSNPNSSSYNIVSMPNYRDWLERSRSFEGIGLMDSGGRRYNLTGEGQAERSPGVRVTASFFKVLGVQPMMGRTFLKEEEDAGRDRVVVLSHGLWTRRYGADPAIVGKAIQIDRKAHVVVGVMPASFVIEYGVRLELWVPVGWTEGDAGRTSNSFVALARLKPGVTVEQARSEMDTIGRALSVEHPVENAKQTVRVEVMSEFGMQRKRTLLWPMLAVVAFVLLIACVNVANLMLARAASRSRELAIRATLGAGRGRIIRQLLTESLVLACAGGIGGLAIAYWGAQGIQPLLPSSIRAADFRPVDTIGIDVRVLAFTSVLAIGSGMLFGLAPAFAAFRNNLATPLRQSARGTTGDGKSRLRYGLVAIEVALTLIVLAGAGVMLVSVARLLGVDPGLDPKNVLVMAISPPQKELYYGPPDNPRFCEGLTREVGAVPGVISVGAISHLPLAGGRAGRSVSIEGRPDPGPSNMPGAAYGVACPDAFKTLGIPFVDGREFTVRDSFEAPAVAIINRRFAREHWKGEQAVGKRFKIGFLGSDNPWMTVVGVVENFRHGGLDVEQAPTFYRPYHQAAWPLMVILAKTASAPEPLTKQITSAIAVVEPDQPVSGAVTMESVLGGSVVSRRFPMYLLSGFAVLALVLAAVGIAGVVGYSVVQRTPEIGVRVALGAQRVDVLRLILGHSLAWALAGVIIGIAGAIGLLRLLGTLLYDVTATDPIVLGSVSVLLIAVVLGASYLPARRAMRVDAVTALRQS
jgi:putative ABC transport system permease protein